MNEDGKVGMRLRQGLEHLPALAPDIADVARRAGRYRARRRTSLMAVAILAAVGVTLPLLALFPLGHHKPSHVPASTSTLVSAHGLSIDLLDGWDGRVVDDPGSWPVLQVANFALPPLGSPPLTLANDARTAEGPGEVVLLLQDQTTICPCADHPHRDLPVTVAPLGGGGGMEGVPSDHAFGRVQFETGGRYFDLWAEFGSDPAPPALVEEVNSVLATLVIAPVELPSSHEGWVTHLDLQDGVTEDTPPSWTFNDDPVPDLIGPRVLFAVGTWPVPTGGECLPSAAAQDLPSDGALLFVLEYGGTGADGGFKAEDFPERNGSLQLGPLQGPLECLGEKAQEVLWQQGGRYFQAYAMFGQDAPDSVRADLVQSLNSVQPFDTSCESQMVRPGEYQSQFGATSGVVGDTVTVTGVLPWPPLNEGGQYVAPDSIELWWNDQFPDSGLSPPQGAAEELAAQPVNGTCRYSLTFRVPDVAPGTYPVIVRVYGGGGYGWYGGTDFRVTG